MILRKPYAFLIKHFKIINLSLLLAVIFCLYQTLSLYSFVKDYLQLGIYNITLNPISNYINGYLYLSIIIILIISGILLFLLKRKDKPFLTYIYVLILIVVSAILLLYINNYFVYEANKEFNRQMVLLIKDLILIDSFFYYPLIFVLVIRSLGIDLKSFGFYEDEAFVNADEEDREEFEVDVAFDKERYMRIIKNKIRYAKYFFLEHKLVILIILMVIILMGGYNFYKYFYVENKIYNLNEAFTSNYYRIKINNSYLTDKDYTGNLISSNNRFFVVIDADITNLANSRNFDATRLFLYVDEDYYIPTTRYNKSFSDMGTTYSNDISIPSGKTQNFILVYEVDKPKDNANFLLKYQDLYSENNKMIRVRIKILDISSFKEKGKGSLNNDLVIPVNLDTQYKLNISNYEVVKEKKYTVESCYLYDCPIYEKTLTASNGKMLLFLKGSIGTNSQEFLSFIKKYGKVRYKVDDKEYLENVSLKITNFRGNYAYLEVSEQLSNASSIELVFTIRTYQYIYRLKG